MGFFRQFADKHGLTTHADRAMKHGSAGGAVLREMAEGGIVGGALGITHAMAPTGLDMGGKVPADALLAGVAALAAVGMPGQEGGHTARHVAGQAFTIFSFRKFYEFAAARKAADTTKPPEQRIAGDRVQEQNVILGKQAKAAQLAAHGDFGALRGDVTSFGADAGAEDTVIASARDLL
jgi:hypothetical protein